MVTTIRAITQELDGFATEYATQIEHKYVDNRPLADEITDAMKLAMREGNCGEPVVENPYGS